MNIHKCILYNLIKLLIINKYVNCKKEKKIKLKF